MDKEKFDSSIKELRELVLKLHRSAGKLDELIQIIESGVYASNDEMTELLIKGLYVQRRDYLNAKLYDTLNEQEKLAWETLLKAFAKEES